MWKNLAFRSRVPSDSISKNIFVFLPGSKRKCSARHPMMVRVHSVSLFLDLLCMILFFSRQRSRLGTCSSNISTVCHWLQEALRLCTCADLRQLWRIGQSGSENVGNLTGNSENSYRWLHMDHGVRRVCWKSAWTNGRFVWEMTGEQASVSFSLFHWKRCTERRYYGVIVAVIFRTQ